MPRRLSLEQSFWPKVDRRGADECWPWLGKKVRRGYGRVSHNGRQIPAARAAYILAHGSFPEGRYACHSCDNPPCVNPAHIWPGTQAENIRDMMVKGRHAGPYGRSGSGPRVCLRCGHDRSDDYPSGRCRECKRRYDDANRARRNSLNNERRRRFGRSDRPSKQEQTA